MVLKMDQRCAYAAKPFVPDLTSQPWIGLSSKASDRLWFRREDKNRVESQNLPSSDLACSPSFRHAQGVNQPAFGWRKSEMRAFFRHFLAHFPDMLANEL